MNKGIVRNRRITEGRRFKSFLRNQDNQWLAARQSVFVSAWGSAGVARQLAVDRLFDIDE
jgi:hypothetical protein